MALQGHIDINGHKYGVVECEYEFSQNTDATGKPTTRTQGGIIQFTIPATSNEDLFFYKWMFNKTQTYTGTFKFWVYTNDNVRKYKTLKFINAYCVGLKDYFCDQDSRLMYTTITISAEMIIIGDGISSAIFTNEWVPSN